MPRVFGPNYYFDPTPLEVVGEITRLRRQAEAEADAQAMSDGTGRFAPEVFAAQLAVEVRAARPGVDRIALYVQTQMKLIPKKSRLFTLRI